MSAGTSQQQHFSVCNLDLIPRQEPSSSGHECMSHLDHEMPPNVCHCHFHCVPMGSDLRVGGWLLCLSGPSSITKIAAVTFWPMYGAVCKDFLTSKGFGFCPSGSKSFKGAPVFLKKLLCTGGTICCCCKCPGIFGFGKQILLERKWDGRSYRIPKYLHWL